MKHYLETTEAVLKEVNSSASGLTAEEAAKRLETIADLVTPGYRASDIGTDHGYVPIYLLRNGISSYVIAADLSPGSLEKAREHADRAGFLLCCRFPSGC